MRHCPLWNSHNLKLYFLVKTNQKSSSLRFIILGSLWPLCRGHGHLSIIFVLQTKKLHFPLMSGVGRKRPVTQQQQYRVVSVLAQVYGILPSWHYWLLLTTLLCEDSNGTPCWDQLQEMAAVHHRARHDSGPVQWQDRYLGGIKFG